MDIATTIVVLLVGAALVGVVDEPRATGRALEAFGLGFIGYRSYGLAARRPGGGADPLRLHRARRAGIAVGPGRSASAAKPSSIELDRPAGGRSRQLELPRPPGRWREPSRPRGARICASLLQIAVLRCGRGRLSGSGGGIGVGEAFFTEVTEPIRYEGLDSTNPLAFKVYDKDRLVLGKRMEDHLRPGVCFWHSFAWPGLDMFGIGTLDRPWLAGTGDPMDRRPDQDGRRLRVLLEDRHPLLLLPRPGRRAGRRHVRGVPREPRRARRRCRGLSGADRRPPAVGHGQPVHPSALPGRRRDQPRPRGVRLRRRPGQAHARGHPSAGRPELRPVGRPRRLRHAAQHRPRSAKASSSPGSCTSSPSTSTGSASAGSC